MPFCTDSSGKTEEGKLLCDVICCTLATIVASSCHIHVAQPRWLCTLTTPLTLQAASMTSQLPVLLLLMLLLSLRQLKNNDKFD
jgi:hypothetical protein